MKNTSLQLIELDGQLYFASDTKERLAWNYLVLYRYPEGDCDTFRWPLDTGFRPESIQRSQIALAMADAREMGRIGANVQSVVLPDGSRIDL